MGISDLGTHTRHSLPYYNEPRLAISHWCLAQLCSRRGRTGCRAVNKHTNCSSPAVQGIDPDERRDVNLALVGEIVEIRMNVCRLEFWGPELFTQCFTTRHSVPVGPRVQEDHAGQLAEAQLSPPPPKPLTSPRKNDRRLTVHIPGRSLLSRWRDLS